MRKIKKKYMVSSVAALLLLLVIVLVTVLVYRQNRKRAILVSNWDGMEKRYVIAKVATKGEPYSYFSDSWTTFTPKSDEELEIALKQNPDYIGEIDFYDEIWSVKAKLFYSDNNYFVLYYDESNEFYRVQSCSSRYQYNGSIVNIPIPVDIQEIAEDYFHYAMEEFGINLLDTLFDHYTFEDACEFYSRFDDGYAEIDEENHQIHVTGYDTRTHELIPDCIIINFDDRTLDGIGENGERILIDGK